MEEIVMKCGHTVNAITSSGKPCCVMCDCYEIMQDKPSLDGRMAHCHCGYTIKSAWNLPFFKYEKDKDEDQFYCGCDGWD